jgi:hypothetical protein
MCAFKPCSMKLGYFVGKLRSKNKSDTLLPYRIYRWKDKIRCRTWFWYIYTSGSWFYSQFEWCHRVENGLGRWLCHQPEKHGLYTYNILKHYWGRICNLHGKLHRICPMCWQCILLVLILDCNYLWDNMIGKWRIGTICNRKRSKSGN